MHKITLTALRYGETSSKEEYYAKDEEEKNAIINYLFARHEGKKGVVEYSAKETPCSSTDDWDEVYWTFESGVPPKWGYTIEIKPVQFGLVNR